MAYVLEALNTLTGASFPLIAPTVDAHLTLDGVATMSSDALDGYLDRMMFSSGEGSQL